MTNNYNAALYEKNSEYSKMNEAVLKEVAEHGRCNGCYYFNFKSRQCLKKNENGEMARTRFSPITYTEPTDKGGFVHVLKPSDCKDYKSKAKKTAKNNQE